jgi:hypothetical protein
VQLSGEKKTNYMQPSLSAPRALEPGRANAIEKKGLWSTDYLHGGLCRWPFSFLSFANAVFFSPFITWMCHQLRVLSGDRDEGRQLI